MNASSASGIPGRSENVGAAIAEIAPGLIGSEIASIRLLARQMDDRLNGHGYAKAAFDMALLDLLGQKLGVPVSTLLDRVRPQGRFAMAHSYGGYTTNLALEDLGPGKAWVVWEHEGEPLSADHGGPVRLLVPHLYFWKSAKWVSRLELLAADRPGFWEQNGYHDRGDPWLEQRYQGDP